MSDFNPDQWNHLPIRTCQSKLTCSLCLLNIKKGEKYRDGNTLRKRAHLKCLEQKTREYLNNQEILKSKPVKQRIIQLYIYRPKDEVFETQYGYITHYQWLVKEAEKLRSIIPGRIIEIKKQKDTDKYGLFVNDITDTVVRESKRGEK